MEFGSKARCQLVLFLPAGLGLSLEYNAGSLGRDGAPAAGQPVRPRSYARVLGARRRHVLLVLAIDGACLL